MSDPDAAVVLAASTEDAERLRAVQAACLTRHGDTLHQEDQDALARARILSPAEYQREVREAVRVAVLSWVDAVESELWSSSEVASQMRASVEERKSSTTTAR